MRERDYRVVERLSRRSGEEDKKYYKITVVEYSRDDKPSIIEGEGIGGEDFTELRDKLNMMMKALDDEILIEERHER